MIGWNRFRIRHRVGHDELDPNEAPFRIDSSNNAGGGNFSARLWLGNVWLYSDRRFDQLRNILKGNQPPISKKVETDEKKKENTSKILKKIMSGPNSSEEKAGKIMKQVLLANQNMNSEQKNAIKQSLMNEKFSLIQGFPGSG